MGDDGGKIETWRMEVLLMGQATVIMVREVTVDSCWYWHRRRISDIFFCIATEVCGCNNATETAVDADEVRIREMER